MFQHQGPSRSSQQNRLLAGYLALIGGFVNSAGYLLIGSFTSHVTGNVGRVANDLAAAEFHAAAGAMTMIIAFFAGAFAASMAIESDFFGKVPYAYGFTLCCEGGLLVVFMLLSRLTTAEHPRVQDAEAALLCGAMGVQNSLVTRLSGAVVRTTHLTGVVTDLGIEAARWFRWWRGTIAERVHVRLSFGHSSPEKPAIVKVALLATIAGSFMIGAVAGAMTVVHLHHAAMLIPSAGVFLCAIYAFASGRAIHAPNSRA
ncbi:MAG: YoaK family protein [Byssovorax sp.]